jgi:hypothetical protein
MTVYQPADQEGWQGRLFVRTDGDPYPPVPAIARTIHDLSAEQAVQHASTLEDIRAEVLTPDKLNAVVFAGFAAAALLISVVGVAGVLAFSVSGRTHEFGIRMALGARPKNIMTDVLMQGLTIAGTAWSRARSSALSSHEASAATSPRFICLDCWRSSVRLRHPGHRGDRVGRARSTRRTCERGALRSEQLAGTDISLR